MGPRAGLYSYENRKPLAPVEIRIPDRSTRSLVSILTAGSQLLLYEEVCDVIITVSGTDVGMPVTHIRKLRFVFISAN